MKSLDPISWEILDEAVSTDDLSAIPMYTLSRLNTTVNEYTGKMTEAQCERYLKVKLGIGIRETGIRDYVKVFYDLEKYFDVFYELDEIKGQASRPVLVDTLLQIQSINKINLNGEFMDVTIALSMKWNDARLQWDPYSYDNVKKIRARKSDVWIPDLNVINRIHDFSPVDEKIPKCEY